MRRVKNYELEREPFEHPVITYRDRGGPHIVTVPAGKMDEIEVFREKEFTYVLYWNPRYPRVGIEKFLGNETKGNLLLHSEAITDVMGKRGLDNSPVTRAKKLSKYLIVIPERKGEDL